MAKLPFVVEPRLKPILELVGSEDSGKIEIERRGFLSAGEKAFLSSGTQDDNVSELMLGLVRKVCSKYKLDIKDAYEVVAQVISGTPEDEQLAEEIRQGFSNEVTAVITSAVNSSARTSFLKAFCLLLYRVDATLDAEDVMEVHPDIIEDLVALYDDEEAKSIQRLVDAHDDGAEEEAIEGIEKK
jgi:hypothetical protein